MPKPEAGGLTASLHQDLGAPPLRRVCLILGMHRSGTSALARSLALLGAALPRRPVAPSRHNETGYWEPASIVAVHEEILASAGTRWDDMRPFPREWFTSAAARGFADRLAGLLTEEYGDAPLTVLKDPRLCRLMPLWWEVLRQVKAQPLVVMALRHPAEVAASLATRDNLSFERSLLLWLDHVLTAEQESRGKPRILAHYSALLEAPEATLRGVAAALKLPPPSAIDAGTPGVPVATYRHHQADKALRRFGGSLGNWVERLYVCLQGRDQLDAHAEAEFDAIREELGKAMHYFAPVITEGAAPLAAECNRLSIELDRHRQEQSRILGQFTSTETEQRRLLGLLAGAEAEQRRLLDLLAGAETEQRRLLDLLAGAETEQRRLLDLLAGAEAEQRDCSALLERTETALRDRDAKCHHLEAVCTEQRSEIEELSQMTEFYRAELSQRTVRFKLRALLRRLKDTVACPPRARRAARHIRASGLFDVQWYRRVYPDVAASAADPVLHYVRFGVKEGRKPNKWFDTHDYLSRYPELVATATNPFVHYIKSTSMAPPPPPPAAPQVVYPADRRLDEVESKLHILAERFDRECHRIDYALAAAEGIVAETDAFHAMRATPAYQAAFQMDNPLVSVCVATCNRGPLLVERAIASLQAQTYSNLQIVVVGDHCTDDTEYLLSRLHDDRIVFHNLPQRGPYPRPGIDRWRVAGTNATNMAMDLCEGQFVTHLDDDDAATVDRIEVLLRAAQQERADLCWHPFLYQTGNGVWATIGNGRFEEGQITTGSIFYHRYLARFKWDVNAYRLREPGDWNRLRRIRILRPRLHFVAQPLLYHYKEQNQGPFVAQPGECYRE